MLKISLPKVITAIILVSYLVFAFLPVFALAQGQPQPKIDTEQGPKSWCEFIQFIKTLIQWVLVIGLIIGIVAIIWGGISFLTAGGDAAKAGQAGKTIGFAAVGIVVIVLAFALVRVIASLTGVNIDLGCEEGGSTQFNF